MPSQADRASWMKQAACKGADPSIFFPPNGDAGMGLEAKAICAECVVRDVCLDYALSERIEDGIWGGKSARDRRRIKSRLSRETHSTLLSGGRVASEWRQGA